MRQTLAFATAVVALVLGGATFALAGVPTDTVREYTDAVVRVLEDPALKVDDRRAERRAAVRKIAIDIFDVQETARRALGPHWQQRSPEERAEFVQLFADLLERTYINKIDLFGGERLKFTEEKLDGDHAIVRAKVITKQGTEVPVEARMINRSGNRWQIYDIVIENISLIGNYRSQFDRIIRASSYGELAKRLRVPVEFVTYDAAGRVTADATKNVWDVAFVARDPLAGAAFVATRPGHWHVDLHALARQRLLAAGVARVHGGGLCTISDPRRFYSHRRDQRTGRMATLVWHGRAS